MQKKLIAICTPTYKRPKLLGQLLRSLNELREVNVDIHVVIADNDPQFSAKDTFDALTPKLPFASTYVAESTRGLASVRNRLVAEARLLDADFIAFIDDDETAHPDWLATLFDEIERTDAAAVAGRQVFSFDEDTPASVRNCYPSVSRKTGTTLKYFSTANVLIRTPALGSESGPFDTKLNLTGGEDSMLSARLSAAGKKIIHCNEAETHEHVPSSKTTIRYILKRAFRSGTTKSKIVRWSNPSPIDVVEHVIYSLGVIGKHGVMMIANALTRRDMVLFRLKCIISGIGSLVGTFTTRAYSNQEYATTHGE